LAREIAATGGPRVRDLTGTDLRDAIIALAAVDTAVTNDSGLMHVAAAIGTATIALFGPTSPRLWAPLNPLAAAIEPPRERQCPQCGQTDCANVGQTDCANVRHRDVNEISVSRVLDAVKSTLTSKGALR
jgi:heptosyltransferase-2